MTAMVIARIVEFKPITDMPNASCRRSSNSSKAVLI